MALAGALLAVTVGFRPLAPLLRMLDRSFWPAGPDEMARSFESWAYSVTFATMAGWGVAIAFLAGAGFPTREIWVWWAVVAGLAVWYPLDTARSVIHRVYLNAAGNTVLLLVAAIPLALTYAEFR